MSSLFDMISSFIALLMSAAFMHFGAAGGEEAVKVDPPVAAQTAPQRTTEQTAASLSGNAADWPAKTANQTASDATHRAKADQTSQPRSRP